jgi:dTDP-4-dehydrorhamnose reductase
MMASCLELWGGTEPTVNRVRDTYFDQIERTGHSNRLDDLDRFGALGIRALRFPVLWERTAPDGPANADWRWADQRLDRLRALDLPPIVGLVHHGSGPRSTSLIDPLFPEKLAEFARAVAERYPWVDRYTPINEPLTTARFSGLYGHWYPHGRDDRTFVRSLLTECRATVLAMRAIRAVNSTAQLIQTDDLGKTFSTATLAYQAAFDNERRWLTWDVLTGRVGSGHPLWAFLLGAGADPSELDWFRKNPCSPDIIGINAYITSQRHLDERLDRYPSWTHGTNGRHRYADVEAVRVDDEGPAGVDALLREAWERYRLPVAITEVHLGCTREGQLRWLLDTWEAAQRARRAGVDIRAVTVWALLGSYDWDSLVTRDAGHYEPGAFDVRGARPRPTAIAGLMQDLASGRQPDHPALSGPGWWRRPDRVLYRPIRGGAEEATMPNPAVPSSPSSRPLLITGARGTLGRAFARVCEARGLRYRLLTRAEMDIAKRQSVDAALDGIGPWAVINAAGYVRVDDAERELEACFRENMQGPATLAAACAARGLPLVTFSSDLVFDGTKGSPYLESDPVAPLNVYGRSKAEAERQVLAMLPSALVIRTSAFFGPWDDYNFVTVVLRELRAGRRFVAAGDATVSPTYVPDLVNTALDLLIDGAGGLWHLANAGAMTWADLARHAATMANLDPTAVDAELTATLGMPAPRPLYSVMSSEHGAIMPSLDDALGRYFHDSSVEPGTMPGRL